MSIFDEYERLGEPDKAEKAAIWKAAIGLQDTDGLKVSDYLISTAKRHIDGEITIDEVREQIDAYYKTQGKRESGDRTEEADKVAERIAEILAEKTFAFSPLEYVGIHKRLFDGIYEHAGKFRDYNITKKEWVLNGNSVFYQPIQHLRDALEYDFDKEKKFNYKGLSLKDTVERIAAFISGIWQIHPFCEGNTRTTAVFTIKYLTKLGFDVDNTFFESNSWYFRNALVRANYENFTAGVFSTNEYLMRFFGNLLLGEANILKNRDMQVKIDTVNGTVNHENDTVKSQNDTVFDTVNDTVFNLIKTNNSITANEIAQLLGLGIATVKRKIKVLKDNGFIERVGSDKTGSWKIVRKNIKKT